MTASKPPQAPRPVTPTGPKPQAPTHPVPTRPPTRPAGQLPAPSQGHLPPAVRDPMEARSGHPSAVATTGRPGPFSLPEPPPLRFTEGEHRLYGHIAGPAEAEAEVIARLIVAANT